MVRQRCVFDDEAFSAYRSAQIVVKPAAPGWETQQYFALRKRVFDTEQQFLQGCDQDGQDFRACHIVALSSCCGVVDEVVGAVRIFADDTDASGDTWFGGRLCVAKHYRGHPGVARALVEAAVAQAVALGCKTFLANVQQRNRAFFQAMHWQPLFPLRVAGQWHWRMQAPDFIGTDLIGAELTEAELTEAGLAGSGEISS